MHKKQFSNFQRFLISHLKKQPSLLLFVQFFWNRVGKAKGTLESIHEKFIKDNSETISLDLGCGPKPKNLFNASKFFGIDLNAKGENIYKLRLGVENIPFDDNSVDYITAYDLIEHIPRYSDYPEVGGSPFIFLMNDIYRVLKKDGVFLSMTPVYPFLGAFQDPTHNNIMTVQTFQYYFSKEKLPIANHYGIKADFEIKYQRMLGQHLVAVLQK